MDNELLMAMKQMIDDAIQPLTAGQARMESDISGLKSGQARMESDISDLKSGQAGLREDLNFVRGIVVRMEVEHGKKLDSLADGYSLLDEKLTDTKKDLKRLEFKVDDINLTVGVHDVKLENMAK